MKTLLFVAAGGALGASARYLVGVGSGRLLGFGFPWGTLTVNVLGCFLMGLLIGAMALRDTYVSAGLYLAASVGLSLAAVFLGLAIVRAL